MKRTLLILAGIILAALIAAGSFWGGMAYQTQQAGRARAAFMNARGLADGGQLPLDRQVPGDMPFSPIPFGDGRGAAGLVKSIDGNVLALSTAEDVTTVQITDSTQIEKTVTGALADLQPGVRVMVTGERDSKGNLTASRIQILNGDPSEMPNPTPRGAQP